MKKIVSICGVNSESYSVFYVSYKEYLRLFSYMVYINNLRKLDNKGKFVLFADNTAILFEEES